MTLNQLHTLTDEERALALLIVFPEAPEVSPLHLTWYKHDALVKKLLESFPRLLPQGHPTYSSLLIKLGIQHEIKYEQPPVSPIPVVENPTPVVEAELTASNGVVASVEQPITGSCEITGSIQ